MNILDLKIVNEPPHQFYVEYRQIDRTGRLTELHEKFIRELFRRPEDAQFRYDELKNRYYEWS